MKSYLRIDIILFHLLIFAGAVYLTYHQVYTVPYSGHGFRAYASDTGQHLHFLTEYIKGKTYIPHPLWHLTVYEISKVFHVSIKTAAVIVSSTFITLWASLVYMIVRKSFPGYSDTAHMFIAFIIVVIGPLCIPWYNKIIYLGQGSPNIWHNVTLWAVKPFALLGMVLFIWGEEKNKITYFTYALFFSLLSIFAKPSFIIVFIPSLLLYLWIRQAFNKQNFLFLLLLIMGSALILSFQYMHTFGSSDSYIMIDFLGVWSRFSSNIPVSILLALAFPIMLLVFHTSVIHDKYLLLTWIMTILSIIYFSVLAQGGKYYTDGNFGWSYMISMSLLYLFSVIEYFRIYDTLHSIRRYILLILLLIQTYIGVYYLYHIMIGQNPVFTGCFL